MQFEWDDAKAQRNIEKHGVRFDLATRVFDDPGCEITDVQSPC